MHHTIHLTTQYSLALVVIVLLYAAVEVVNEELRKFLKAKHQMFLIFETIIHTSHPH